jgi:hypothetical protein
MEPIYSKLWYSIDPVGPASFTTNARILAKEAKGLVADSPAKLRKSNTVRNATKFIRGQRTYARFRKPPSRPVARKFSRSYLVSRPFKSLSMDTLYILRKGFDNFKFIVISVDNFSNLVHIRPCRKINAEAAVAALREVLESEIVKSSTVGSYTDIVTDRGSEFRNQVFTGFLKEHRLRHFLMSGKAVKAEVAIRNLRMKTARIKESNRGMSFVEAARTAVRIINQTPSTALDGLSPLEACESENANKVLEFRQNKYYEKLDRMHSTPLASRLSSMKVGDPVRIRLSKSTFEKESEPSYSEEVFKITRLFPNKVSAQLETLQGEELPRPTPLIDLFPSATQ